MQVRADGGETELTKYTHEGVQHEVGGLLLPAYSTCTTQMACEGARWSSGSSCRCLLLAAAHCYLACVSLQKMYLL